MLAFERVMEHLMERMSNVMTITLFQIHGQSPMQHWITQLGGGTLVQMVVMKLVRLFQDGHALVETLTNQTIAMKSAEMDLTTGFMNVTMEQALLRTMAAMHLAKSN
jgi:hypothetical protein